MSGIYIMLTEFSTLSGAIGGILLVFLGFSFEWLRRSGIDRKVEKNKLMKLYYFQFHSFFIKLNIYTKPLELGDPDTTDWEIKMEGLLKDYRELQFLTDMHFSWLKQTEYFDHLAISECLEVLKSVWIGSSLKDRDYGFVDQGKLRQRQRKLAKVVLEQQRQAEQMLDLLIHKRKVKL